MPNIQIRGSQIQAESVEPSNINLSGSFDFRAATGFQIVTKPEADNSTFPASTAYVHTIVSGSVIDGSQGGDGISRRYCSIGYLSSANCIISNLCT